MSKKIFRAGFFVSLLVLLSSIVLIFGVLFKYFERQLQRELKSEAGYISYAVENEGISYIAHFEDQEKRITLIAPDGEVLADTKEDAAAMENHLERKEVKEALEKGSGTSIRYSSTMTEKTVYFAQRLKDGNILRISATQYTILRILWGLFQPLSLVLLLSMVLSFLLSQKVSEAIIKPINSLDLNHPAENVTYEELTPLLAKISDQRKTIDRQLKEAAHRQEEFRLITENMSEGFLVIDRWANLLTYNQASVRLLGIDEQRKGSVLILNRTKSFRKVIGEVLEGRRTESDISLDDRDYKLIASPVFGEENVMGAVIVILDITENVKREQLRREFTSNVSHELKTPLTSISGFAEIMKSERMPEEAVMDFSNTIYQESQRLITLVNDIIKLSEMDEGTVQFEKEKVDLYEVSADILGRLEPLAEKRNIGLNLMGGSTVISGVPKMIDEMLYNLCDNAIKYNKDGGTVDVILSVAGDEIRATVRDTGIGISPADQERVFERFYRVDKSHSKANGGTGLGLSIVKHAALYHDAEITLSSTLGKGTSITLTFGKASETGGKAQ